MTVFQLKLIAIITMFIDHIGYFFFPKLLILRIIGRISFPIFAWLIANGVHYSRNIKMYLLRLFFLALISQPFTFYANIFVEPSDGLLNVVFTLSMGLAAIMLIRKSGKKYGLWALIVTIIAFAANYINADYGVIGIMSIVFFYIFFNNKPYMILSQILIFTVPYIWTLLSIYSDGRFTISILQYFIEPFAVLALPLISLYNGKEGIRAKYLFYTVYPLQYVVIVIIQQVFLK